MVDAEIQIYELWQRAKDKNYNIIDFLNVRKKRLCVTLMFLCDLTPYSSLDNVDLELLKHFGDFYETKGTVIHDLVKW